MLKYILVKNHLVTDPSMLIPHVNSQIKKNLNDVITMMISEGTGLTRPQALAYFEKLTQTVEYFLSEGHAVITPLFKVRPTMTGLFIDKQDSFDPSRHQIRIRTATGVRLRNFSQNIDLEKNEANQQIPLLNNFIDVATGVKDTAATPGGIGTIYGKQLKFTASDPDQGVFFESVTDPTIVVRSGMYARISAQEVHFLIPALESGVYRVKVASEDYDGETISTGVMKATITV